MIFKLSESFLDEFKGKQPKWGPLGYFVYKRTYARGLDNGGTEEFWQTLRRVVEGVYTIQKRHCDALHLPWKEAKAQKSAQEMYRRMWEFKFLPPGRGLWAFYMPLIEAKGGACLNNCCFVSTNELSTDFAAPFTFAMDMLMLGVGVGGDLLGAGTVTLKEPKRSTETFVVEDSREGWISLIEVILNAYVGEGSLPASIDYTKIRKAGMPIVTFGGTSSGPEPLMHLVVDIEEIAKRYGLPRKITTDQIVDIFNVIGKCVVSGNVRRSAELILGDADDIGFRKLKQDKAAVLYSRWASNNSLSCKVGMDYTDAAIDTSVNGEPGYIWLDNARKFGRTKDLGDYRDQKVMGFNPCAEQSLESFELCTLVETFPSRHESYEDYEKTLKYAYLYAKTVTLIPTHDPRTNAVMMRNRRIGTSMSGIVQAFKKVGRREFYNWCDKGYAYLRACDNMYSDWLCVPRSIKISTVKPSGTVSLLPGVTPGIHYPHGEYYIRNVRISTTSPLLKIAEKAGYPIEADKYSKDTAVISFPVKEEFFEKGKDNVTIWEQLENAAQMQYYWSDNSVSITVTFQKDEASQIKDALELYETRLKTVSFLPALDHGYEQAPYITITKDEYEKLSKKIKPLAITGNVLDSVDKYCDGEACVIN